MVAAFLDQHGNVCLELPAICLPGEEITDECVLPAFVKVCLLQCHAGVGQSLGVVLHPVDVQ